MDYRNNKHNTPSWDDSVYGTGNTSPPKNHSGIIALLLILVIFLSGIVSVLSFMNVKLFRQLSHQQKQTYQAPMALGDSENPLTDSFSGATAPSAPLRVQGDLSLKLNKSPQSVENMPQENALSWQEIYEKNLPSVASVEVASDTGIFSGSGVVLSPEGYLVTTFSLVDDAQTISVGFHDGSSYSAVVVGADSLTDLAVLYVDAPDLHGAEFGDSDALRVGDPVAAIGDPMGAQLGFTLTDGIISAINRDVPFLGQNISLIQNSAALSTGNSGGPLINCYGQVIGISTTAIVSGEPVDTVGFAIPSTTVKQIVDQLIAQGYVSGRPTLGLSGDGITQFDRYYFHIPEGLYLNLVSPDSDAFRQGIAPGDILISLNGIPVTTQAQLDTIVNSSAIGQSLEALFFRDGKEEILRLTVTEYTG